MLLNFQKQFALWVWDGRKNQTIRAAGKGSFVPAVGDTAHCYTGLRTVSTQLLGKWPISRVETLRMTVSSTGISAVVRDGKALTYGEVNMLAKCDGFPDAEHMGRWFAANHAAGEFSGWQITWDWSKDERGPQPVGVAG